MEQVAQESRGGFYARFGKRCLDLVVSVSLVVAAAPLFGLIALAVLLVMGRPILFSQLRPGLRGRPFRIFKFRTMALARDVTGTIASDAERLTPLGKFLRRTSLDELPELWNVARGDMSLVGPRPLLPEYLELYDARQARRHDVRPGITGLAQVNGRNRLTWEEKFEYDVEYVESLSPWLDVRILMKTVWQVIRRESISAEGHVTMPRFRGSGNE